MSILEDARRDIGRIQHDLQIVYANLGALAPYCDKGVSEVQEIVAQIETAKAYDQAREWGATITHYSDEVWLQAVGADKKPYIATGETLLEAVARMQKLFEDCPMVVGMDPGKPGGDRNGCVWRGLPQYPNLWNIPLDPDMADRLKRGTNGQGGRQDFHRALVNRLSPEGVLSIDEKLCKTLFAYCEGNFGHAEHLVPLAELVQQAQEACPPASLFEEAGK